MRILFMGTPDFSIPSLKILIEEGHEIVGVITQKDKKVGRKQILTPPIVKQFAQEKELKVFQPDTLKSKESFELIKNLNPEIIVVVAFGKILPKDILDIPKYGCVNVHASLLPKYRGAAPIQRAVLNGDSVTGVCIMDMDVGLDTGDIIRRAELPISIDDTSESMFDKLSVLGAKELSIYINDLINNKDIHKEKQIGEYSYAEMIDKSLSNIDWNCSAIDVHNKVRGLYSWPLAQTSINGKECKIIKTVYIDEIFDKRPGTLLVSKNSLKVVCGDKKAVEIITIEPLGKKAMDSKSFMNGNKLDDGTLII